MNPTTRNSLLLSVLVFGLTLSCQPPNDPDPPVDPGPGVLALELYASPRLTSMQVKLSANPADLPLDSLVLLRNDQPADTLKLTKPDTVLSLTGLTPSTTYIWKVTGKKNTRPYASNPLPTRTMDTTSHHFTWQVDTIGAPGSILWDVAIVNDTCVWVVGDILKYPYDSSDRYNAAMWNGKTWTKVRINTPIHPSGTLSPTIIYTILYVDGQLWITTDDGGYAVSDNLGKTWKPNRFPLGTKTGSIKKGWASSKSNIYWVGTNGSITHYDGKNFRLVESGTDIDLTSIASTTDHSLWISGIDLSNGRGILIRVKNNLSEIFFSGTMPVVQQPYNWTMTSVGGVNESFVLVHNESRLYKQLPDVLQTPLGFPDPITPHYTQEYMFNIRGTGLHNFFMAGNLGGIWHFNGVTMKKMTTPLRQFSKINGFDCSERIVFGVGSEVFDDRAFIVFSK